MKEIFAEVRRRSGFSGQHFRAAFAAQLGIPDARLGALEAQAAVPTVDALDRLARLVGVESDELSEAVVERSPMAHLLMRGQSKSGQAALRSLAPSQSLAVLGDFVRILRLLGKLESVRAAQTDALLRLIDLHPRAGRSHAQAAPLVIAWASPPAGRHPREPNLFLAQVRGDSMLPTLSDGQWCLFAKTFAGDDWLGQHCLIREVDPSGLTAWSVKRVTAIELGEADQRRLQLTSLNPAYGPRELTVDAGGDVGIEAVLREALSPNPARRERKKPPTENGQA